MIKLRNSRCKIGGEIMIKAFKRFIERLAESNEETYKGGKLDCCDLNKSDNSKKQKNPSTNK